MIKGHPVNWVVTIGALATAGAAITATQLINTASNSNSSSSSNNSISGGGTVTGGGGSVTGAASAPKATKTPTAEPPSKSLELTGALNVSGLAPGSSFIRTLTIGNPNNQDVELQSVKTLLTGPSPSPSTGTCTSPADVEVFLAGYNATTGAGTVVTIKKNSMKTVPVTVRMHDSLTRNQDACKGRTWTFTFTATANSK